MKRKRLSPREFEAMERGGPKLVGYLRVSTKQQDHRGFSLGDQDAVLNRVATNLGGRIVAKYTEAESGGNRARPELAKAIEHARRDECIVVVAKLDRLARDVRLILELVDSGVPLHFADLPDIPPGPSGRLMLTMFAAVAEFERGRIRERTQAGIEALRQNGMVSRRLGRVVALGGRRQGQRPPTPEERAKGRAKAREFFEQEWDYCYSEIIPVISEMRGRGDSLSAIARHLNGQGWKTRGDGQWSATQVRRVVRRLTHGETT